MTYREYAQANVAEIKGEKPTPQNIRDLALLELWLNMGDSSGKALTAAETPQNEPYEHKPINYHTADENALQSLVDGLPVTDFVEAVRGKPVKAIYDVLNEYFEEVKIISPRQYWAIITALQNV